LLSDLDLFDVKDLQVGSPLNRLISGGQRKKLNIALELIREPWVLFADEPTSGLSSSDSEEIMQLLSEQTSKGKIVIVNIHQPSSDVFKLFDKIIVLDREGFPVYFGNPIDAIPYFNDYFQKIYINADICEVCNNVNPEAIFKVLEEKKINEFGEFIKRRKTTPFEWHQHFVKQNLPPVKTKLIVALPKVLFSKPGAFKQFLIFNKRNILSKLANTQYMLLAMIISPALAAVLSSLCRYNNINESATEYFYAYNENIPSYFFMSVIVALFLGLIMSAEEIIRDRKIVMRESYLRLSKLSYINSKIAFVFGVSAIQSLLYVLIGNSILGIESMNLNFWLIMFSTSCFANILGLLISSLFNSVIAVYIMVPLIIVPQMLLSGVVVNYDKINKYLSSNEFVPFVGDIMASRWAYEAMVVNEFRSNNFQKYYFDVEQEESNVKFNLLFVIPELKKAVIGIEKNPGKNIDNYLSLIRNESKKLRNLPIVVTSRPKNTAELKTLKKQLDKINDFLSDRLNILASQKDSITRSLIAKFGGTELFLACKSDNYNNSLADLVLRRKELEPYAIVNNKIVRQMEPIYQIPNSNWGRAQFLSAVKKVSHFTINTFSYNIIVIWTMSIIGYGVLVFVSGARHSKKLIKLMNGKHSKRFK
jgi:ABC transport system ATP-binding/permease protein